MSDIIDTSDIPRRRVTTDASGRIVAPGQTATSTGSADPALRPFKEELALRATSVLGAAAAWPIRLVASFIESLFGAVGALIRILIVIMIVPSLGLFMYNFNAARDQVGPREISRAAGIAVGQTISGITAGLWSVVTGEDEELEKPKEKPKTRRELYEEYKRQRDGRHTS